MAEESNDKTRILNLEDVVSSEDIKDSDKTIPGMPVFELPQPAKKVEMEVKQMSKPTDFYGEVAFPHRYARRDHLGQIILDMCETQEQHFKNPMLTDGMRPLCRSVLENFIPEEYLGKKGTWKFTVSFTGEDQNG